VGGGPSAQQNAAAQSQANLTNQLAPMFGQQFGFQQQQQQSANPFYKNLMQNGSPFYQNQMQNGNPLYAQVAQQGMPNYNNMVDAASGNTAQAFAPAKAGLEQQLGQSANALPSGFAQQARTDLASQQGRAFDQQLQGAQQQNFQAKMGATGAQLGAQQAGAAGQYGLQQAGAGGLLGQAQIANPLGYAGAAQQGNNSIMQAPLASPGLAGLLGGIGGGLASALPF
jgi:hypothetical protein